MGYLDRVPNLIGLLNAERGRVHDEISVAFLNGQLSLCMHTTVGASVLLCVLSLRAYCPLDGRLHPQ